MYNRSRFFIFSAFWFFGFLLVCLFAIASRGPEILLEPANFLDPTHTAPCTPLAVELKISNIGDAVLNVSDVSVDYYLGNPDPGLEWMATDFTSPIQIPVAGFAILNITLNSGGVITVPDPSGWDAEILLDTDTPSGTEVVHVHLTIASDFDIPQGDTIYATNKSLAIYNTGRLGGNTEGHSLDIPGDCDDDLMYPNGDLYLRDASPMIAWNDGSENLAYTTLYDQYFTEDGTFRPQSGLTIYNEEGYDLAVCTLSTADSIFGVGVNIWAPNDGNDFIIIRYDFTTWKPGLKGMDEVYLGMIVDWDIPSDGGVDNFPGYDENYRIIWQRGVQTDLADEDPPHSCPIVEDMRYGGIACLDYGPGPMNVWTAETTPMLSGSGMDPDSLYNRMAGQIGYNMWTPEGEDTVIDLHTGVTFDAVDMTVNVTYSYAIAMVTTNTGYLGFIVQVQQAKIWADPIPDCWCLPGDANNDEQFNVGDVVHIINYVFKGGPPPAPFVKCNGDANRDCKCDIGDAVYGVNHIFKGGPPPPGCWLWLHTCGWYW